MRRTAVVVTAVLLIAALPSGVSAAGDSSSGGHGSTLDSVPAVAESHFGIAHENSDWVYMEWADSLVESGTWILVGERNADSSCSFTVNEPELPRPLGQGEVAVTREVATSKSTCSMVLESGIGLAENEPTELSSIDAPSRAPADEGLRQVAHQTAALRAEGSDPIGPLAAGSEVHHYHWYKTKHIDPVIIQVNMVQAKLDWWVYENSWFTQYQSSGSYAQYSGITHWYNTSVYYWGGFSGRPYTSMYGDFYNWDFMDINQKTWITYSNTKIFGNLNGTGSFSHSTTKGGEYNWLLTLWTSHGS